MLERQSLPHTPDLDSGAVTTFKSLFWKARQSYRKKRDLAASENPEHQSALALAKLQGWLWAEPLLTGIVLTYRDEDQSALDILKDLKVPPALAGELYFTKGLVHHGLKNWDTAIECYRKAIESPDFNTAGDAWHNMGVCYGQKGEIETAIECYRKAMNSPSYDTPGDAWLNIGIAYSKKKEFDTAIDYYRKALESPGYETPGDAWNNMGVAYSEQTELDTAIDCHRKALESPGYDTPGDAWNNMGVCYSEKGEFDTAIDCYRKALESPGYDTPGHAWNNMGISYGKRKEFDAAIDCYHKALESQGYDTPHQCLINLAIDLREYGRLADAKIQIEQVLSEPDKEGQHVRARILLSAIKSAERGFAPDPDEDALTAPAPPSLEEGPEGRMKKALMDRRTRYEEYLSEDREAAPDGLSILRGWSSSVTLLEGAQDCQWSGGGYFLKWRGKGLIVDPGFDFLDNFHQAGFHATDIHAVVVSHNHPDHNADLNALDNLCYEIARIAEPASKFLFAMDEDTAGRFLDNSPEHRGSPHKFTRFDYENLRWLEIPSLPFIIEHFPVKHGSDVPHANGLRFRLLSEDGSTALVIGYTGDGEYTEDLSKHLKGVDLLIAHVSQPDTKEFNEPSHLKKNHLGYNGAINLIKDVQPKLTLIGEFWAGLADLRLDLIAGIRLRSGVDAILPACLGLHLSLPDLKIPCSRCRQFFPAAQIRIAPPINEFGLLGYLCNHCIL